MTDAIQNDRGYVYSLTVSHSLIDDTVASMASMERDPALV